mmetsp:Transcript_10328/g.11057  ORF Transcript_10328/g.11057 Transcript_10328/m.11057 type:complete len:623 (-) Transcript_10328:234-2102(-)
MKNYRSIQQDHDNESNEGDALINRPTLIPERNPSYKKHFSLVGVVALFFLLAYNHLGTTKNNAPNNADAAAAAIFNCVPWKDQCGDQFCCSTVGVAGRCQDCCINDHCVAMLEHEQPPAGEFGKYMCVEGKCQAYANGESSQIPPDGYPVWALSETLDNSNTYQEYKMPRTVYKDGPLLEQVWHIDFNEQDASFDKTKVDYNGTHITIPSFDTMHAAYSRSYNHYDEHETGIVTLVMMDNNYSVVADYPAVGFVEKYHTLTYDGIRDTSRGDYIKAKAKEQIAKQPSFNRLKWRLKWLKRAVTSAYRLFGDDAITRQLEGGVDKALSWQIRRYVRSYPEDDVGSVNPSSSATWASHSKKAKQAIVHAKDPTFERDYMKSETHCKHIEEINGVSYTQDSVTIPVGRPLTIYSGEMVNSPVHYLGLAVGHVTLHYDSSTGILEMFYQTFSHSRQHTDVEFPGPYANGLWVAPVADGNDYVVDPDRDGRGDQLLLLDRPDSDKFPHPNEADFTLWARPTDDVCNPAYVDGILSGFWESTKPEPLETLWETLRGTRGLLAGMVGGMPCSSVYMHTDYGGGHNFDMQEIGVWGHSMGEIRADKTKEMLLATFWDDWECFYANKCASI